MQHRLQRLIGVLVVWNCLALAFAVDVDKLVPVRWPGGPLEVARRAAKKADPAILKDWYQPASLDLLHDTPINCLLVTWSAGGDPALVREQQQIAGAYAKEAHQRGFTVLGLVYAGADAAQAVEAAAKAHLDGLALEPDFADFARLSQAGENQAGFLLIPLQAAAGAPGIRVLSDSGATVATPTSEPWMDSNLWLVRSLRAKGQTPVWLGFALENPSADNYARAIADSAAAGGRWVVAPDDGLLGGLSQRQPDALATWRRICEASGFFEQHAGWRPFVPAGPLGIARDPSTRYPDVADENLNLIARRRIPYRMIDRAALNASALEGVKALLVTEISNPAEGERSMWRRFAEGGGLLVTGPGWGVAVPKDKDYIEQELGKGQLIVYREETPDPEALSKNLLHLLGKGNLGLRLFNAPTVLPYLSASEDGKQLLVQMINYASGPSEAITVRVSGSYRTARLYGLYGAATDLPVEKSEQGIELAIGQIHTYAALLLER
ncbi:MAG: hypothetical protein LAP39_10225 [Acidobacteriia bacterium]|nr:hypothetical protein [Terriglobia bacterium]